MHRVESLHAPRSTGRPSRRSPCRCRQGPRRAKAAPPTTARTRQGTARADSKRGVFGAGKGGATRGYVAYDGSAVQNLTGLTSRRPFTLLGILLAVLVIGAFVLVALNAGSASGSPAMTVVVATKDLQPRLPIDAASLALKTIAVPNGYPKVYFTRIEDVQGMVPLVTIG